MWFLMSLFFPSLNSILMPELYFKKKFFFGLIIFWVLEIKLVLAKCLLILYWKHMICRKTQEKTTFKMMV